MDKKAGRFFITMSEIRGLQLFHYFRKFLYFFKSYVLITIIILLIVGGIAATVYSHYNPSFDYLTTLSGISTYAVALLTAIYAYISLKQLEEIQKERELQNQPLPWITKITPTIEKPQLFCSPPNKLVFHSRFLTEVQIKNIGAHPAVCIDVLATVILFTDTGIKKLDSVSMRINTLEEKQTYPNPDNNDNFLFPEDNSGEMIKSLLSQDISKYPIITFRILYKNILGGCFVIDNSYRLFPISEGSDDPSLTHEDILKNWIGLIRSIPVQFEKELTNPKGKFENCNFDFDEESEVDEYIEESLIGSDIDLIADEIPGKLTIKSVSPYDYEKMISEIHYGKRLYALDPNSPSETIDMKDGSD